MGKFKLRGHTLPGPNQKASIGKNLDLPSADALDKLEKQGTFVSRPNSRSTNAPELDNEGNVKMYLTDANDMAGTKTTDSEGNIYTNKTAVDKNKSDVKRPELYTTENLSKHSSEMRSKYDKDGKLISTDSGSKTGPSKNMKFGRKKK